MFRLKAYPFLPRFRRSVLISLLNLSFVLLLCVSCALQLQPVVPNPDNQLNAQIVQPLPDKLPPLPFDNPNILGIPAKLPEDVAADATTNDGVDDGIDGREVAIDEDPDAPLPNLTMQSALTCLATGRPVYGVAKANTNVRIEPEVAACRIGRAPRGTLLRVTGIFEQGTLARVTSLRSVEDESASASAEDGNGNDNAASSGEGSDSGRSTNALARNPQPTKSEVNLLVEAFRRSGSRSNREGPPIGFEEDILPIFQQSCAACHNEVARTSGLVVTDYDLLLQGSERGVVVEPGSVDGSMLWWQIFLGKMPVIGELSGKDKDLIKAWIEAGAPERRGDSTLTTITSEDDIAPANQANQLDNDEADEAAARSPRSESSRRRSEVANVWLQLNENDFDDVPNACEVDNEQPHTLVSGNLIQLLSCGVEPTKGQLARVPRQFGPGCYDFIRRWRRQKWGE